MKKDGRKYTLKQQSDDARVGLLYREMRVEHRYLTNRSRRRLAKTYVIAAFSGTLAARMSHSPSQYKEAVDEYTPPPGRPHLFLRQTLAMFRVCVL